MEWGIRLDKSVPDKKPDNQNHPRAPESFPPEIKNSLERLRTLVDDVRAWIYAKRPELEKQMDVEGYEEEASYEGGIHDKVKLLDKLEEVCDSASKERDKIFAEWWHPARIEEIEKIHTNLANNYIQTATVIG